MFIKTTKRNIQLIFLLAFIGLNIFFLFFYNNLRKVENDHKSINHYANLLGVLPKIEKDVSHLELSIKSSLNRSSSENINQLRRELDTLFSDTIFLLPDAVNARNDSLLALIRQIVLSRTSVAREIIVLLEADRRFTAIELNQNNRATYQEKLDIVVYELEIISRSLLANSNIQQVQITNDTFNKFHILAVLFNFLFLVFYFFVFRNIKLQEAHDRFLQNRVLSQASELSRVYERITDAFLALDNEWRYTYLNAKSLEYHGGIAAEQLLGRVIWEVTPELINEPFYKALHESKATNQPVRLELYYSKEGIWFEDLIYPTQDGVLVFYHDITEKKNSELALKASEKKLKQAYEQFELVGKATNDALYDWHIAENDIWGNDSFNSIFDINENRSIEYSLFISRIHPDDRDRVATNYRETINEKSTYISEEFRFQIQDGTYQTMYNRAYLLYDQDGQPNRMVGAMQDITIQKLARQQLLLEKELSDSIINSLPGIFYLFNKSGKLFRWNKNLELISGYSRDEISKLHPLDFFDASEKDLVLARINNVFLSGKDDVEASFFTKGGQKIPYLFNGMRINFEGEECLMGVGIDLTEKVRAHDELRELATHLQDIRESERTYIAREIHDELGQQLTGLKMDISWINRRMENPEPEVKTKIIEILGLIDETVKTVRRISSQLRPSILDDLGLIPAMEWQIDEFRKRSEIRVNFHTNIQHSALPSEFSTGLFRIFQESLTNVFRHANATEIDVELSLDNDIIRLEIWDNGIGLDHRTIQNKKTLGLLGMKERTLLMGGTFEVIGVPGQGTTVNIQVPMPKI